MLRPPPSFILDGKTAKPEPDPAAWDAWMRAALKDRTRVVARSRINPKVTVSTVFAGFDQRLDEDSPDHPQPVLFETAVFNAGEVARTEYHTDWDEAESAHAAIVAELGGGKSI